jgi:hypothetical protein
VAEHDFIFQRSLEDFRWRYRDPRGGEYTVKYAAKDNEIIGYVVLGEKIVDNYPVGYIVELISLQEFSLVQDRLIGEAVEYFRERRVNLILFLSVSGKSMEHFLRRHMFVPGEPLYLTYTLGMYDEDLLKWEPFLVDRVHFCYGDFDYI